MSGTVAGGWSNIYCLPPSCDGGGAPIQWADYCEMECEDDDASPSCKSDTRPIYGVSGFCNCDDCNDVIDGTFESACDGTCPDIMKMTYEECRCRAGVKECCPVGCGFKGKCGVPCPCDENDSGCCLEYDGQDELDCLNCVRCKNGPDDDGSIEEYFHCSPPWPNINCTWIQDTSSKPNASGIFSPCLCDCHDSSGLFYPSSSNDDDDQTNSEIEEWMYEGICDEVSSCCVSFGKHGWPGSKPQDNSNFNSWYFEQDGPFGSNLVGWLCGWNSLAHNAVKDLWVGDDWTSTIKYCLDENTCPALFTLFTWPPGCVGDGCGGEFIINDTIGMGLRIPLNVAGCELGIRFGADSDYNNNNIPCLDALGSVINQTEIGLRGCPMKNRSCFDDYDDGFGNGIQIPCCPNPHMVTSADGGANGPVGWNTILGRSDASTNPGPYNPQTRPSWLYDIGQPGSADARQYVSEFEIFGKIDGDDTSGYYLGPGGRNLAGICHVGHGWEFNTPIPISCPSSGPCPPEPPILSACCNSDDESCIDWMTEESCLELNSGGGSWNWLWDDGNDEPTQCPTDGSSCSTALLIEYPNGACCIGANQCRYVTELTCLSLTGNVDNWNQGECGSSCSYYGACCYYDSVVGSQTCTSTTQGDCESNYSSGVWHEGFDCSFDCSNVGGDSDIAHGTSCDELSPKQTDYSHICGDDSTTGSCCFINDKLQSTCVDGADCVWCQMVDGCWGEDKCEDRVMNEELMCCTDCKRKSNCDINTSIKKRIIESIKSENNKTKFRSRNITLRNK